MKRVSGSKRIARNTMKWNSLNIVHIMSYLLACTWFPKGIGWQTFPSHVEKIITCRTKETYLYIWSYLLLHCFLAGVCVAQNISCKPFVNLCIAAFFCAGKSCLFFALILMTSFAKLPKFVGANVTSERLCHKMVRTFLKIKVLLGWSTIINIFSLFHRMLLCWNSHFL
jgi:hypothetical protein